MHDQKMSLRFSLFTGLVVVSLSCYPYHFEGCPKHEFCGGISCSDTIAAVTVDSLKIQFEKNIMSLVSAPVNMSKVCKTLKQQLNEAQNDAYTYGLLTHLADSLLYESDSPYRNDVLYEVVIRHELSTSSFSKVEKERLRFRLHQIRSNRVGSYATDFSFFTRKGEQKRLSELSEDAEWLVIFFDPDCMQCQLFVNNLRSNGMVNDRIHGGYLHILAVNTNPDVPLWERIKNDLPASWMVARDRGIIRVTDSYDLRSYPAVYLLDKHRKVILKNTDLPSLLNRWSR